jgi:hypothetical protein
MVDRSEGRTVPARSPFLLQLRRDRTGVMFRRVPGLYSGWAGGEAAGTSVIADVVVVYDDVALINIGDACDVDVGDGAVIEEGATAPLAAVEAGSGIAEAVVNASVKTNRRSPVAGVPDVETVVPPPVARGPEQAYWPENPSAGNPVIAIVVVPGPIAGSPDVAWTRTNRLGVDWQRWRAKTHGNSYGELGKGGGGERQE